MKNSKSVQRDCAKASSSCWALFLRSRGRKRLLFPNASRCWGSWFLRKNGWGCYKVNRTEERRAELRETIQCILKRNSLSGKEAERLGGRMVFFEGYAFGRVANHAVRSLSRRCSYNARVVELGPEMKANPNFLHSRVLEARAISIERSLLSTWFVFTDGACSQDYKTGSVGGVLVSPGILFIRKDNFNWMKLSYLQSMPYRNDEIDYVLTIRYDDSLSEFLLVCSSEQSDWCFFV